MNAAIISSWLLRVPVSSATPTLCTTHENTVGTEAEPLDSLVEVGIRHELNQIKAVSGSGGSHATMRACARVARVEKLPFEQGFPLLVDWNEVCAFPPWKEKDLRRKLLACYDTRETLQHKWPPMPVEFFHRLATRENALAELRQLSDPAVNEEANQTPGFFLSKMFAADDLLVLCLHKKARPRAAMPCSWWLEQADLSSYQFYVPNPALNDYGLTQEDKISSRAHNNFCAADEPRHFIVVECDFKVAEQGKKPTPIQKCMADFLAAGGDRFQLQAAVILELMAMHILPLLHVTWSGRHSFHAVFDCRGLPPRTVKDFFNLACQLGADPTMWAPAQLCRLPWGTREDGQRQEVIYLNPTNSVS